MKFSNIQVGEVIEFDLNQNSFDFPPEIIVGTRIDSRKREEECITCGENCSANVQVGSLLIHLCPDSEVEYVD